MRHGQDVEVGGGVEPREQPDAARPVAARRFRRIRLWQAEIEARGERLADRAQTERRRHGSVDAVFEMVDRDGEVGGGILAGALAYRLFIWLLPLALVAVVGLGAAADATSKSPEDAAKSVGLGTLVSSSVASTASDSSRWYALIVGIPILVWTTRSLLRALIGAHRLVWTDVRSAVPKPTIAASVRLLVLLVACFLLVGLDTTVRHGSFLLGLILTLLIALPYAGIWMLISMRLPHRDAPWQALVPGALLFGLGVEALHVFAAYFLGPYSIEKQGTYGALGVSAVLLLGLYLLSRLVVFTAVVNATLWARHTARTTIRT